jgi:hypothetical protein
MKEGVQKRDKDGKEERDAEIINGMGRAKKE